MKTFKKLNFENLQRLEEICKIFALRHVKLPNYVFAGCKRRCQQGEGGGVREEAVENKENTAECGVRDVSITQNWTI